VFLWRSSVRYARRSPGVTVVAVATMSIGIACVATLFGFLNSVRRVEVAFPDYDRISAVTITSFNNDSRWGTAPRSIADELLREGGLFERVGLYREGEQVLAQRDTSYAVSVAGIDSSIIPMLGLGVWKGRTPSTLEIVSRSNVALVTDHFWRRTLSLAESSQQESIILNGVKYEVVGVMRPEHRFYRRAEILIPLERGADTGSLSRSPVGVIAKRHRGEDIQTTRARLRLVRDRLALASGRRDSLKINLEPSMYPQDKKVLPQRALLILLGIGVCVFLTASANVANLLLVRAAERAPELALRAALGATKVDLLRASVGEPLLLGLLSAAFGAVLTKWATASMAYAVPTAAFTAAFRLDLDVVVLGFVLLTAMIGAVVVGSVPAMLAMTGSVTQLMAGGTAMSGSRRLVRIARRGILGQLAATATLFIVSGLLWRSFAAMDAADLGFPAHRLVQPTIRESSSSQPELLLLLGRLQDALASDPRVIATSIRGYATMADLIDSTRVANGPDQAPGDESIIQVRSDTGFAAAYSASATTTRWSIDTGFFRTAGLRLETGRNFLPSDRRGSTPVAIVSRELSRLLWGQQNPVGRHLRIGRDGLEIEVVGVVSDYRGLDRAGGSMMPTVVPALFFSREQVTAMGPRIVVRATVSAVDAKIAITSQLRRLERNAAVVRNETIAEEDGAEARLVTRILATLSAAIAAAGILVGVIGTYGVVSYSIAVRRHEIGIRAAMGASGHVLVAHFVGEGLVTVWKGLATGAAIAAFLSFLMRRIVFGVSFIDPVVYGTVLCALGLVGVVAVWLPARRAARVEPMAALKAN
jgi:putative ABC transport system permease protein